MCHAAAAMKVVVVTEEIAATTTTITTKNGNSFEHTHAETCAQVVAEFESVLLLLADGKFVLGVVDTHRVQ